MPDNVPKPRDHQEIRRRRKELLRALADSSRRSEIMLPGQDRQAADPYALDCFIKALTWALGEERIPEKHWDHGDKPVGTWTTYEEP